LLVVLSNTEPMWLSAPSPWQPGKWKPEVLVKSLIEQIKNASSQGLMAALPSVPPGPFETPVMPGGVEGWGGQGI
jgi:hypothetical protein